MELLSVIRRGALRDQLSIREIRRGTGLSRNTIRKYLRGDVVEPAFKAPERSSKLDAVSETLADLNDGLEQRCRALWQEIPHRHHSGSVADAWTSEAGSLMPLSRPFDGFVKYSKRVSPTCLIRFDRNRNSVPASFANHRVSFRIYPDRIVVVAEGKLFASMRGLLRARMISLAGLRRSPNYLMPSGGFSSICLSSRRRPGDGEDTGAHSSSR